MINMKRYLSWLLGQFIWWGALLAAPAGWAADSDGAPVPRRTSSTEPDRGMARPKSPNVTINLIHRLVERGVLSADDARELIQQAENDAAEARAQARNPGSDPAASETVSVRYVPEIVKLQIRDEIKDEVLKQARAEHWAAPNTLPAWVSHFGVKGDLRVRYEDDLFPKGNDTTGAFPNFNSINSGSPYDLRSTAYAPQRNVDQDRNRLRLRARLGAEINLENGFTVGLRLATGENNSPVTQNQSLGAANSAQGGNFSKYAVWLDQAFLKYELGGLPTQNLAVSVGRFENPFFSTSILWANDLGFDGLAVQGRHAVAEGVTPFFTAGAFPVFNTDLNFSSTRPQKYPSEDKWLYGGQLGVDWKVTDDLSIKGAGAFYYFDRVEGKLSDPIILTTAQDQGNTDDTRPAFAQYGNTYMMLRNINNATSANNFGQLYQYQYFGLATPFQDFAFTGRADYKHFEPFTISLTSEFVKNIAFNQSRINGLAVNNRGADLASGAAGPFAGGDTAWIVGIKLGAVALQKRWDWNIGLDYRYVESDAVVDGFCDSDFGGGGTNVKGYSIHAALALAPKIALGLHWMSSDQVAGPTLKADTLQLEVNAKW